jgi:hypothetical protein
VNVRNWPITDHRAKGAITPSGRLGNLRIRHTQGLRSDTADAAGAEQFREDNRQVDRQEEQIAHESNVFTRANLHKTAR